MRTWPPRVRRLSYPLSYLDSEVRDRNPSLLASHDIGITNIPVGKITSGRLFSKAANDDPSRDGDNRFVHDFDNRRDLLVHRLEAVDSAKVATHAIDEGRPHGLIQ